MLDTVDYFEDADIVFGSPPLQAVIVKSTPSPSPTPIVTQFLRPPPAIQSVSSPLSRRQKKSNRRKTRTRPTLADWVLIREMDPNRPDIAQQVSEQALNSDTGSEDEDDDMVEDESFDTATAPSGTSDAKSALSNVQSGVFQPIAHEALGPNLDPKATATHRDSVLEDDVIKPVGLVTDRRKSQASAVHIQPNCVRPRTNSSNLPASGSYTVSDTPFLSSGQQLGHLTNSHLHDISSAANHGLRQLTIPQSRGHPTDTLPALQAPSPACDRAAGSPSQQLPSFRHIDDIARSASIDHDANRTNGFVHRQSISSVGQSPTSIVHQLSISSHSPATPFPPLSASSPISTGSDLQQRGDLFLRSGGGGVFGADARRPSQAASENGPYPTTLHSASTSESYQSSDGISPGTQQTPIDARPRHMSLDGALASRVLPPPLNSGILIPPHAPGSFKCDYPSCNAAPFQTQYLLNSHTNVHSSSRPHYCPVKDCTRSEGGKGFKRKNEMIRHGLVHQSPGYVCPFCPDREHRYPRPDNLQRHVRVHHLDKDKDDPQLRDVLAQRPEGGSRGRRRRVSDSGH
ncbi:hypothetical protein EJ02DRAFT_124089 [Clathrospora elynae]|uniref:C2H2-type domain-containing protein n=1 Tax=Clathrospora elynae TaxID=706981 RepID=A0A6A5SAQ2_9PLEO|nr:hypothetical protein EJ02DRAFT_124089 [Clathrospora elynae]